MIEVNTASRAGGRAKRGGQRRDARVGAHLRFVAERSELERVQSFVRIDGSDRDAPPEETDMPAP